MTTTVADLVRDPDPTGLSGSSISWKPKANSARDMNELRKRLIVPGPTGSSIGTSNDANPYPVYGLGCEERSVREATKVTGVTGLWSSRGSSVLPTSTLKTSDEGIDPSTRFRPSLFWFVVAGASPIVTRHAPRLVLELDVHEGSRRIYADGVPED